VLQAFNQYNKEIHMNSHNMLSSENIKGYFKSRNLPHIFAEDKPIFITYRLKFTLPQKVMDQYKKQVEDWNKDLLSLPKDERITRLKTKDSELFDWFDRLIAMSPEVPSLLHRDGIREIIEESFKHFDGLRYTLLSYCIMPNHVHVLILPRLQENGKIYSISHTVYTWKKYTAAAINKSLGKKGSLWQKESYDSLVMDYQGLGNVLEYIINNPVKAGLVAEWQDWKGTYVQKGLV
jgi:REP element-mobilizing transposase RayT